MAKDKEYSEEFKKQMGNGFKTTDEQREIARQGGIASGEAKRARKNLRDALLDLLDSDSNQDNMNKALMAKALNGDTKAFEIIRDTIGEKAPDKKEIKGELSFLDLLDE